MKRKLLFVAALVVSALGFNAHAEGQKPVPNASPLAEDGNTVQYLYNVEADAFLVGGNDWGTRASVLPYKGYQFKAKKNGETWTLTNYVESINGWKEPFADSVNDIYLDRNNQANYDNWVITTTENNQFKISNNAFTGNLAVVSPINDDNRLYISTETDAQDVWIAVSEDDYKTYLTARDKYNKSIYQVNEDITGILPYEWIGQSGLYGTQSGIPSFVVESYQNSSKGVGDVLTQTIDGLKNGKYKVTLKVAASYANNNGVSECPTGENLSVAFAQDETKNITVKQRTALNDADYDVVTFEVDVMAGVLQYGIKNIAPSGNWYVASVTSVVFLEEKTYTIPENTDMTAFITNPQINGANGWTTERPNGGNGVLLNNVSFEYWAENATPVPVWSGRFNYYQKITELPKGVYTIGAEMYNSINGVTTAQVGGECGLYGATATAEVFVPADHHSEVIEPYTTGEIAVTDGTLTIGVKNITNMNARWFVADNFKLTYVRALSEDEESKLATAEKQAAVKVATDLLDAPMTKEAKAALQEAIDGETDALWEAINEARTQHMDYNSNQYYIIAIKEYNKSKKYAEEIDKVFNAGEFVLEDAIDLHYDILREELGIGENIDYTPIFLNAVVNRGGLFWSGTGMRTATDQQYTDAPDNTYLDANAGTYDVSQTLKGLPAGKYEVKVATRAAAGTNGHIYVNVNSKDIGEEDVNKNGNTGGNLDNGWDWTTCEFTLETESDVRLGIYATLNDTWVSVDDWHLTYVSELTSKAEITDAKYTAYVTEFDTDFSRTDDVTAYKVTKADVNGVELEPIEAAPKGTAVILYSDVDNTTEYTIYQAAGAAEIGVNLFTAGGNQKGDGNTIYALGNKEGVGFYLVKEGVDVPANKGYLEIVGALAKAFIPLGGEGEATGIEAVEAQGNEETVIYNLAGQRVANPTNGIYIVNGKKVLINK